MGHAIVLSVERNKGATAPCYPWRVEVYMGPGSGSDEGRTFHWQVPNLDWTGYNWSRVSKPEGR